MKNIVVGIVFYEDTFVIIFEGCYLSKEKAIKKKEEVEKLEQYKDEKLYDFVDIETHPILK